MYAGCCLTLVRRKRLDTEVVSDQWLRLDTEVVSDQWLDVAVNMLMFLPEENAFDHHSVGSIP